jgi:predicted nucleic acid-binding protein
MSILNSSLTLYPTALMLGIAVDISIEVRRTIYDSLYLALAVVRKCQMATADEKLVNSFKDSRFAEYLLWVQ